MFKKRLLFIAGLVAGALVLAACQGAAPAGDAAPAVDTSALDSQIADLESQLAAAEAAGGDTSEADALQAELDALQGELMASQGARCTYNAYRMGWIMDYADANNIVNEVFGPTSDFQYTFYGQDNPALADEVTGLVSDALVNPDLDARAATWQEAERLIVEEEVAVVPLYHYDRVNVISTDLNTLYSPFGAPRVANWSFESGNTTLRAPVGAAVPTLDIQDSTDTTSSFVIYQMIDAPYQFNDQGSIEPLAATGFEVSDDGTVFTIALRDDALWSDGEQVTAQHYVDGITRMLSPDLATDYAYVMFALEGAADYNAGELDALNSVVALDDTTLQVTLSESLSYFDSILAFSTMHPVRLDVIEQFGDEWTRPGNFVSNGAYVLTDHNPGSNLVLEKNESYWDAANVAIERIEIPVIEEPATSLAAFEAGEVDMTNAMSSGFPPEDTPRLVDTPEFVRLGRPGVYYMGLNTSAEHTNNLAFRQALASSIDRRTILDNVLNEPWKIEAYGVIPPEIVGYQGDAVGYQFDPAAAQEFLGAYMSEAGIADAGDIVVELWYNKSGANQDILEAVEVMWEDNLGIDVRTVNVEWATYLETLEECNAIGGGGF